MTEPIGTVPEHPSLPPNLPGAIDLEDPVQIMLTKFRDGAGKGGATACVVSALMPTGDVAVSFVAPGGLVQALGMVAATSSIILETSRGGGQGTQGE